MMTNLEPSALVHGLFLAPDDFVSTGVAFDDAGQFLARERVELFHADDRDVLERLLAVGARLGQVEINLAGAEHDPLDLVRFGPGRIVDDDLEAAVGEILEAGYGIAMPEQTLWREHHQRLAVGPEHLASDHMEHLAWQRWHADLNIVVRAQLHEALQARRGVLGTLALVTVRQVHDQAAQSAPLGFARSDELVDDHLGAVDEIAELSFPDHQRAGFSCGVAVFEPEHGFLAEQRVDDGHLVAVVGEFAQRRDVAPVFLVEQYGVAMKERPAARILADQTQSVA